MVDVIDERLAELQKDIDEALAPFAEAVELLKTIPGIGDGNARTLIAEIGVDMSRFKTPGHLVLWAGMCPRMDESAGKRRSTKPRLRQQVDQDGAVPGGLVRRPLQAARIPARPVLSPPSPAWREEGAHGGWRD